MKFLLVANRPWQEQIKEYRIAYARLREDNKRGKPRLHQVSRIIGKQYPCKINGCKEKNHHTDDKPEAIDVIGPLILPIIFSLSLTGASIQSKNRWVLIATVLSWMFTLTLAFVAWSKLVRQASEAWKLHMNALPTSVKLHDVAWNDGQILHELMNDRIDVTADAIDKTLKITEKVVSVQNDDAQQWQMLANHPHRTSATQPADAETAQWLGGGSDGFKAFKKHCVEKLNKLREETRILGMAANGMQ